MKKQHFPLSLHGNFDKDLIGKPDGLIKNLFVNPNENGWMSNYFIKMPVILKFENVFS